MRTGATIRRHDKTRYSKNLKSTCLWTITSIFLCNVFSESVAPNTYCVSVTKIGGLRRLCVILPFVHRGKDITALIFSRDITRVPLTTQRFVFLHTIHRQTCLFKISQWNDTSKWAASWQNQQHGMCAQQRLRSAWASAQSDQSLRCPLEES